MTEHSSESEREIAALRQRLERLTTSCTDLENRLLHIENSRLFRLVRWPGRILLDWKRRLGQMLLHSPFHPLYLKLAGNQAEVHQYQLWLQRQAALAPPDNWFRTHAGDFRRRPRISIVMPVHNPRREWLEAAVQSVVNQSYECWELCVCDDASTEAWPADYFTQTSASEPRIRFVRSDRNLGISGAANLAGGLATGDYAGFLDQDDLLSPHALYYVAEALQENDADLLYSDEDRLDGECRVEPIFKPDWSPDLLLGCMYLGHFLVSRRTALERIHWLRTAFDGSQDYDLALRLTDTPAVVRHIPHVLYHWRKHPGSTAAALTTKPYTHQAGMAALADTVARRNWQADILDGPLRNSYRLRWHTPADVKASIVIPSRNPRLLEQALAAIERRTAYRNREILVVHHRHDAGDTAIEKLARRFACKYLVYDGGFNFSAINNLAARSATGQVLVFLNDDVEPLEENWLSELASQVLRPDVAIAGALLRYPLGAVQHAGLALGIMQGAGHIHRDTFGSAWWKWLPFTRDVSAVTGACLAVRAAIFAELGGFAPDFPVNYNDADLCLRARQAGYRVLVTPAASLRHRECQTRTPGIRIAEREHWEDRWGAILARGDPFYSAALTTRREDCSLAE